MENILITLVFVAFAWHFWYQRNLSEYAMTHAKRYCDDMNLQFMSVARHKTSLVIDKRRGLVWKTTWCFEFSGDGESKYDGELIMLDQYLKHISTPVYKTL